MFRKPFILVLSLLLFLAPTSRACTIFVLTNSNQTLFFNNEDYSNPSTRIWFVPASNNYYGVAYVGFDNDWAQGGVNTAGLAFDWVADARETYQPDEKLKRVRGNNPSERMLESCSTIDEAIAFYQQYQEPAFSYARLLIADKTGASVIIGARDSRLYFDRSGSSRGLGFGATALNKGLSQNPSPSLADGLPILEACKQEGADATKYSSIYDLLSGDITLLAAGSKKMITLNINKELLKGGHYYNIPDLTNNKLNGQPLRPGMRRFLSDGYKTNLRSEKTVEAQLKLFINAAASGTLSKQYFTEAFWLQINPQAKALQEELNKMGSIRSLKLFERNRSKQFSSYLYLIEFDYAVILQRITLDRENRLSALNAEGFQLSGE